MTMGPVTIRTTLLPFRHNLSVSTWSFRFRYEAHCSRAHAACRSVTRYDAIGPLQGDGVKRPLQLRAPDTTARRVWLRAFMFLDEPLGDDEEEEEERTGGDDTGHHSSGETMAV